MRKDNNGEGGNSALLPQADRVWSILGSFFGHKQTEGSRMKILVQSIFS